MIIIYVEYKHKEADMKKQFKWLWHNMSGRHTLYIFAILCTVVVNIMQLVVPVFTQKIVDIFLTGENAADNLITKKNLLYMLVAGMVLCTFIRTVIAYVGNMSYERASQHMIIRMRAHLYRNVGKQSMEYYDRYRTGDLMTRMTGDLDAIRHMAAWVVRMLVECFVLFTATAVYFFLLDPLMAVCMLILCPVIFIIMAFFRKNVAPLHSNLRESLSEMNTAAQENISGNKVVKAFAREEYEKECFDKKSRQYSDANRKTAFMWLKYFPMVEGCANGLSVVLLLAGGLFIIYDKITFGEYAAFSGLIWSISSPMRNLGSVLNEFQRFVAASEKVMEIYYAEPVMKESENPVKLTGRIRGEIEFKNVSFGFDNQEVLKNISFKAKQGETIAIMGETGSGKTSLINLIPRFFDPYEGEVLVDGINVKEYAYEDLRRGIGMATQDVLLYSDTIDGNIAYGNSRMSNDTVRVFANVAAVTDFVRKMPEKFSTLIGERGVGLSGGQKQRIALARALAIKPSILILDDTTSAVDMETEKTIQENLRNLDFDCTKIIIAQRISSTKEADKIIILEHGQITEMGTHKELIEKKGYYYNVYALQNGLKEERKVNV